VILLFPARWLRLVFLPMLIFLTACLPETQAVLSPTPTPTETLAPTPTETILWFPLTPTFTGVPTRAPQPTREMHPGLGAVMFNDDFSDQGLWSSGRTASGSVAYGLQELTRAVSESKGSLQSLRDTPEMSNFYLEIDVLPSLCRDADQYGLLLRANTQQDYYRLLVNCKGQLRLERVKDARVLPLQDWLSSGQVPPGAMLAVRLGVWALGDELRFFVNDIYQFAVRDPLWKSGRVGLYARAAGDTPLTVSFSNLQVQEIDVSRIPTPEPTSTQTVLPSATRRPTATNSSP
jgi:hypothetical protein